MQNNQSHVTSIVDSFDFRGLINWPGPLAWELFGRKVALKLRVSCAVTMTYKS